jgi:triacylglycerol esterase/lipase EstA (alpha/beta hydrolase family)
MLKQFYTKRHICNALISAVAITALTSGCALLKLQENIDELNHLGKIQGKTVTNITVTAPVIIALIKETPKHPELVNYLIQQQPDDFSMLVDPGKYYLFAYEDKNRDMKYQDNERIVKSTLLQVTAGQALTDITLRLPDTPDDKLIKTITELRKHASVNINSIKLNLGKIVTIDEKYFSPENSSMGMWEPVRFVKQVPFGLFMLQKYNPNKIPVLFVHGINGSPKNFKYIISQLDHKKFQPWIFYYPTGLRLGLTGNFLNNSVTELLVKYRIKTIYVVAHSMGGLVSRSFINHNLKNNKHSAIKLFISISSPWQGHRMAKMGVEKSPVVMPVWNDMAPDSKFLTELYAKKLPKQLPYYLLFSYKGGSNSASETNDGAVTLVSQLRLEAQRAATLVRGYDETHTSILKSKTVSALVNKILRFP